MSKKNIVPPQKPVVTKDGQSGSKQHFSFNLQTVLPLVVCILYFVIHFLPDFDGYDAMGAQWFYMVVLDMAVILFILARKSDYTAVTGPLFKNIFSKLYLAFFALAGLSIFTAINPTEAWICYARIIATIVAFFNISILLKGRINLFRWLAQILGLILLVEAYQAITQFLNGFGSMPLTQLIMSLKGTAGNKNIFAAGLVVKIPFVLYAIYTSRLWGRILNITIFIMASLAIFIINARAAYLSLLVILLLYVAFCIHQYLIHKKAEQTLYRISYIVIPIILSFFVSQIELTSVKSMQEDTAGKDFGSVTERLGSVTRTDDESNQVRLRLWAHAIDYTKHHPIIGCGTGNWKIASIPYQRTITNDLYVPIHAHNDFIEMFAELGIPGGLLYLSLFICIFIFTIRTYRSDTDDETKLVSVFTFMAFVGYAVDAMFNFPTERPISQMFFAFIVALNVMAYMYARKKTDETKPASAILTPVFGLISLLMLVPAAYLTFLTYKSFIIQRSMIADLENEPLKLDWKMIMADLPSIPNLSATAQPIDAIKGRYLYEAGKYEEALVYLEKGRKANPMIGYSEFLKAGVYFHQEKYDSAARNAIVAFYTRPKAKTYYQTLIAVLAKQKDTAGIKKAFAEYDRYRHHPLGWNLFFMGMINSGVADDHLLALADSSIRMFKGIPGDSDLLIRKQEILRNVYVKKATAPGQAPIDFNLANQYYQQGIAAFGTGNPAVDDLEKAAQLFLKAAKINPTNYIIFENAAMCYFNKKEFAKSIIYFDKALSMTTSGNGKSEFFKGVALLSLGRKEGCTYLLMAKKKNYKEKEADLIAILKSHCGVQ